MRPLNFLLKPYKIGFNTTINFKGLSNPVLTLNPILGINQLISAFLFFSLLPYVSPIPIGSDVQLMSGLIAFFIIFLLTLRDKFVLGTQDILLFGLSIFFLLYVNPKDDSYQIRKAIGPLYGLGIFYITKKYFHHFNFRIVQLVIVIYLLAGLTQLFSPSLYQLTFEHFIRESKYAAGVARGINSLTPESSFLGIVSIYLMLILEWFRERAAIQNKKFKTLYFLCIFLVLLSKSGTGYILLFGFLVFKFWKRLKKYWYVFVIGAIFGLVVLANVPIGLINNKGFNNLIQLASVTTNFDLIWRLGSLANRVSPVIVGIYGFLDNPLGYGSGSFTVYAVDVFFKHNMESIFPGWQIPRLIQEISSDSNSTFGKYLFEYGVFYLIFLFTLLYYIDYRRMNIFTLFLVLTSILFSLPIVYPPIWVFLGINTKQVVQENGSRTETN